MQPELLRCLVAVEAEPFVQAAGFRAAESRGYERGRPPPQLCRQRPIFQERATVVAELGQEFPPDCSGLIAQGFTAGDEFLAFLRREHSVDDKDALPVERFEMHSDLHPEIIAEAT